MLSGEDPEGCVQSSLRVTVHRVGAQWKHQDGSLQPRALGSLGTAWSVTFAVLTSPLCAVICRAQNQEGQGLVARMPCPC